MNGKWEPIESQNELSRVNGVRPLEGRRLRAMVEWPSSAVPPEGFARRQNRRWMEGYLRGTTLVNGGLQVSLWGHFGELTPELWVPLEALDGGNVEPDAEYVRPIHEDA